MSQEPSTSEPTQPEDVAPLPEAMQAPDHTTNVTRPDLPPLPPSGPIYPHPYPYYPSGALPQPKPARQSNRLLIGILAALGVLVLVGAGVAIWAYQQLQSAGVLSGATATPTATHVPVPTSPPAPTIYHVGDMVGVEVFTVTINSITTRAAPDAGIVYLVLDVTFQNQDNQPEFANTFGFDLRDSDGNRYHTAFGVDGVNDPSGNVLPGEKAHGQIAFEVPKSAKHFTLTLLLHATSDPVFWEIDVP